jgi:hypothetical protein
MASLGRRRRKREMKNERMSALMETPIPTEFFQEALYGMVDVRLLRFAVPYAGINRFRFEGSDLRPLAATPRLPNKRSLACAEAAYRGERPLHFTQRLKIASLRQATIRQVRETR